MVGNRLREGKKKSIFVKDGGHIECMSGEDRKYVSILLGAFWKDVGGKYYHNLFLNKVKKSAAQHYLTKGQNIHYKFE